MAAIAQGFGLDEVVDDLIPVAHEMVTEAVENIADPAMDIVGDISAEIGEVVGDVAAIAGNIVEDLTGVIETATDFIDDVVGFFEDIWSGLKNFFTNPSEADRINKWRGIGFADGVARALSFVGRAPVTAPTLPPDPDKINYHDKYRRLDAAEHYGIRMQGYKEGIVAGYYDTLRPVHAVMGGRPRPVQGSLAHTWGMILIWQTTNVGLAISMTDVLRVRGQFVLAQEEYAEFLLHRERWKRASGIIWDRAVLAKKREAGGRGDAGLSYSDDALLAAAPGAYAVKAIF